MSSYSKKFMEDMKIEKRIKDNKKGYKRVYVYTGDWYSYDIEKKKLNSYKLIFGLLMLLSIAVYIICSLQRVFFNFSAIVAIPTIATILPMMYELLSIGQFIFLKDKNMKVEFQDTNKKINLSTIITVALLLLTILLAIIISIIVKTITLKAVLVLIGYLFSAFCSFSIFYLHKGLKTKIEPNKETK